MQTSASFLDLVSFPDFVYDLSFSVCFSKNDLITFLFCP